MTCSAMAAWPPSRIEFHEFNYIHLRAASSNEPESSWRANQRKWHQPSKHLNLSRADSEWRRRRRPLSDTRYAHFETIRPSWPSLLNGALVCAQQTRRKHGPKAAERFGRLCAPSARLQAAFCLAAWPDGARLAANAWLGARLRAAAKPRPPLTLITGRGLLLASSLRARFKLMAAAAAVAAEDPLAVSACSMQARQPLAREPPERTNETGLLQRNVSEN